MSSSTLYKWRVYCETEASYVYWWLTENQSAPTTCSNNSAHTITSGLTQIVDTRKTDAITIRQEDVPTGERYFFSTQQFTALANQTTTYSFSYPINISLLETQFVSSAENTGDSWSWVIFENTTIGAITSDVSVSDTVINVSSTVTSSIDIGFYASLFDGTNTADLGMVVAKDATAGTITVQTPSTHSFSTATPTYVRMSIYFCKDMEFGHPWLIDYGGSKIKTSSVPANTVIKVYYTNNHETLDKRIVVYLEYMYGTPKTS